MSANGDRPAPMQVDAKLLTLREYAEIEQTVGEPLETALAGPAKWRAIAAMVWMLRRRDDPSYSIDDALDLPLGEIDLIPVGADDGPAGKVPSAPPGEPPRLSPELGPLTRLT